ncbi:MAG: bifunctional phosphopantothenoylcysteine decarboxylase/phosphopantothenate--cysteine ligase CoaBC [Gammaproteobacteria bacterium]|jgi:phosphopantothenoylcysteine decarboxylase/phosphopantothenate--cysteine ligase|nr:bifunctional phosphopantothenoylcysteine decarboxylase/phosphopantothenate--cysteine ligase CoaBC [Gammaproteobacteria bacterium]
MPLANRRILLGVTGSVAAYKAAELIRLLRAEGAEIDVVLTRGGSAFITPLTLQALAGRAVHASHLDPATESAMGHIELARRSELVLIAPASANAIARLAAGLADDLLTTICLATAAPLAIAPAMNRQMWEHPATRDNIARLRERGVLILGPGSGEQACGEVGPGRMLEPPAILAGLERLFAPRPLAGRRVLITAGPTQEPIDPVRFVSNRSSGRMGYALAGAAAAQGAIVTLVTGPVSLPAPPGVERVAVRTAAEMADAVAARVAACDIFIGAAAVADYRPAAVVPEKLKKTADSLRLELERTPDILAGVAGLARRPFTVGFAAETSDLETHALAKLRDKRLDMIAANRVGLADRGFDAADNELLVLWPGDGRRELALASKERIADQLISLIAERYDAKNSVQGA